jgi:hypothetical protein
MNNQLKGSSSWINMFHGIDVALPSGWMSTKDIPVIWEMENQDAD